MLDRKIGRKRAANRPCITGASQAAAAGTLYAQGRYWYDLPYVSPQSQALRESRRLALYWDLDTASSSYRAWWQGAEVFRREALVGFWSIANPTTLNGYYRKRSSGFSQHDWPQGKPRLAVGRPHLSGHSPSPAANTGAGHGRAAKHCGLHHQH